MYQKDYLLRCEPLQLLGYYDRWRKRAELVKLSDVAKTRLEWLIFYHTAGKKNATYTIKYFGIARSKFYFWLSRFNESNLRTLESKPCIPKTRKKWQPDPIVLARMISLRKKYIHWSKIKLSYVYFNLYGEKISSWQFQRVICEFKLYPARKVKKCATNGAKKQLISFNIRRSAKNLFSLDTKVLHLFGRKYYIVFSVAHTGKIVQRLMVLDRVFNCATRFTADYPIRGDQGIDIAFLKRADIQKARKREHHHDEERGKHGNIKTQTSMCANPLKKCLFHLDAFTI